MSTVLLYRRYKPRCLMEKGQSPNLLPRGIVVPSHVTRRQDHSLLLTSICHQEVQGTARAVHPSWPQWPAAVCRVRLCGDVSRVFRQWWLTAALVGRTSTGTGGPPAWRVSWKHDNRSGLIPGLIAVHVACPCDPAGRAADSRG